MMRLLLKALGMWNHSCQSLRCPWSAHCSLVHQDPQHLRAAAAKITYSTISDDNSPICSGIAVIMLLTKYLHQPHDLGAAGFR